MLRIAIIIGSTRPGRKAEAVANWVYEIAQKRSDAEFELVDIKDFNLPLLDEPVPPIMGQYNQPHTFIDRLFAQIKRDKGKLDVVFANAGFARCAALGSITEELYNSIFDINVKGNSFTVQKALPLPPDGPSIILNASVVASKGFSSNSVYSTTKAAEAGTNLVQVARISRDLASVRTATICCVFHSIFVSRAAFSTRRPKR